MSAQSQLPPFAIPEDYKLEQELKAPIPRAIPEEVQHHPERLKQASRTRIGGSVLLGGAAALYFLRTSHAVQILGMYLTPFAYPQYVAPVFAALGLWGLAGWWTPSKKKPLTYLQRGIPIIGRIVDLRLEVAVRVNGSASAYAFDAYFQYIDPQTQELVVSRLRSRQVVPAMARPELLKCRVGDYVTGIYLPGQVDKTLTLYGFSGAHPDRDLIAKPVSRGKNLQALLALIVLGFMCLLPWNLSSYDLIDVKAQQVWAWLIPSAVLGLVAGIGLQIRSRRQLAAAHEAALASGSATRGSTHKPGSLIGSAFLGLLAGPMMALSGLWFLNGALDRSPGTTVPVPVKDVWVHTYQGLVKTYELEVTDTTRNKTEKISVSPLELLAHPRGVAYLTTHPGALGVPWQEVHLKDE